MNFKYRFLSVALFNSLLLVGLLFAFSQNASAFSQKLGDLNLEMAADFRTFMTFLAGLIAGLVVNILLLSSKRDEFSIDQVKSFIEALRGR